MKKKKEEYQLKSSKAQTQNTIMKNKANNYQNQIYSKNKNENVSKKNYKQYNEYNDYLTR